MVEFPEATAVNRPMPKSYFVKTLGIKNGDLAFRDIEKIVWRNKLSSATLNIKDGAKVKEIHVFEIRIKSDSANLTVLKTIDNAIPYPILFLIFYNNKYQAWLGYKETDSNGVSLTVKTYNKTDWLKFEELPLAITGLDLDEAYANLLSQINSDISTSGETPLRERINHSAILAKLKREIETLTAKMRAEKQFNKQQRLNEKLRIKKEELRRMKNEE